MRETSHFSRELYSNEKMMYYPTSTSEMAKLSNLFPFEEEEITVLEPCIGKGEAVIELTRKAKQPNVKLFGVELNEQMYSEVKSNHLVDYCVQGDFLELNCTNASFSMVFCNPPYGTDSVDGKRLESKFLRKLSTYVKKDGILIWVVPYQLFLRDPKHIRALMIRYDIVKLYKFEEAEYEKYRQVVFIGRRKKVNIINKENEEMLSKLLEDEVAIPLIPNGNDLNEEDFIWLSKGYDKAVHTFASTNFDVEAAFENLESSNLYTALNKKTSVPKFGLSSLSPPLMPNQSQIFTLLSVGRTDISVMEDGFVQRGVVKTSVKRSLDEDERLVERITSSTAVIIIEPTGAIIRMGAKGEEDEHNGQD